MNDTPLQARQVQEIEKRCFEALQKTIQDVAARRVIVDQVLKSTTLPLTSVAQFRELLAAAEEFVHKPIIEFGPIEVRVT